MDYEGIKIDETIYLHTQKAIPMRSKSKMIIPLDTITYTYLFKDYDKRLLLKYVEKKELDSTLNSLATKKSLNPCTNQVYLFNFILTCLILLAYVIVLYIDVGIIIMMIFNPIMIILVVFLNFKLLKKVWGIRLLLLQKRKMVDLQNFLEQENERYYKNKKLVWTLGDKANWIQIEIKKGFLSEKKDPHHNSPTKKKAAIN